MKIMTDEIEKINQYKEILNKLHTDENYFKITKLEKGLTNDEMSMIIQDKCSQDNNTHTSLFNFKIIHGTSIIKLADWTDYFLNAEGLSTTQTFNLKLPDNYKILKNDFIEFELFDLTKEINCDAITNLRIIRECEGINHHIEIVLKINGYVMSSNFSILKEWAELIKFPNLLINFNNYLKIGIYIRCNKAQLLTKNNLNFILEHDAVYFNTPKKILEIKEYFFETCSGVIISYSFYEYKYIVKFWNQLVNTVNPLFKSLYVNPSENFDKKYNNEDKIIIKI